MDQADKTISTHTSWFRSYGKLAAQQLPRQLQSVCILSGMATMRRHQSGEHAMKQAPLAAKSGRKKKARTVLRQQVSYALPHGSGKQCKYRRQGNAALSSMALSQGSHAMHAPWSGHPLMNTTVTNSSANSPAFIKQRKSCYSFQGGTCLPTARS